MIEQLERAAQLEGHDTNEVKLEKLESLLEQGTAHVEALARLFAPLLSISTEGRYPPLEMKPEQQKEQTLEALVAQMEGLSRHQPVLLIFEDVHCADPTSLELLELMIERTHSVPVLAVLTYRPGFTAPWSGHTHVTSLSLNRFTRNLAMAMVNNVTGGKTLPNDVLEQIIERSDGVPLFVEELTKTILESGLLSEERDRYVSTDPLREATIPATLHDSLMARLDRLGAVKEVAQIAAAIGREFDYDLLAVVTPLSFEKLRDALHQLIDAELVFHRGRSEAGRYIFKHALVQDAAYATMLRERRAELHAQIADALVERFPERASAIPELVAHHFDQAGLHARAIDYWMAAGKLTAGRSANVEAVAHLKRGLAALERAPDMDDRTEREIDLQMMLAVALIAARGYSSDETARAVARARALCEEAGDTNRLLTSLYGEYGVGYVSGRPQPELAAKFDALSKSMGEHGPQLVASRIVGAEQWHAGDWNGARPKFQEVINRYDPVRDAGNAQRFALDPRTASAGYLACVDLHRGFPEASNEWTVNAERWADELGHANSMGHVFMFACSLPEIFRRRPERVESIALRMIEYSEAMAMPLWIAYGKLYLGWAEAQRGEVDNALVHVDESLHEFAGMRAKRQLGFMLGLAADVRSLAGRFGDARDTLRQGFEELRVNRDMAFQTHLLLMRAEVLARESAVDREAIKSDLKKAFEIAQAQAIPWMGLRAATRLGRFWLDEGQPDATRDLVTPLYEQFVEGHDLPDLQDAKALLAAV